MFDMRRSCRLSALLCAAMLAALPALGAPAGLWERLVVTPHMAMDFYEGKWDGMQNVFLPDGRLLLSMVMEQTYHWATVENERMLIGTGHVMAGGRRVDLGSRMSADGPRLRLVVTDSKGLEYSYSGHLVKGAVVWTPSRMVLLLDVQNDAFVAREKTLEMHSMNLKDVREGTYSGRLVVRTQMRKPLPEAKTPEAGEKKRGGRNFFKRGRGTLFE